MKDIYIYIYIYSTQFAPLLPIFWSSKKKDIYDFIINIKNG